MTAPSSCPQVGSVGEGVPEGGVGDGEAKKKQAREGRTKKERKKVLEGENKTAEDVNKKQNS